MQAVTSPRPPLAPSREAPAQARPLLEVERVSLRYRTETGEESERTVWPVVLGYSEATSLLVAWCELREDFRHFRTDRVVGMETLAARHGWSHARLRRRWEVWREERRGQ